MTVLIKNLYHKKIDDLKSSEPTVFEYNCVFLFKLEITVIGSLLNANYRPMKFKIYYFATNACITCLPTTRPPAIDFKCKKCDTPLAKLFVIRRKINTYAYSQKI